MFKISSEIIEKCRVCNFLGDCNWVKVANGDMADFVHLLGLFGHKKGRGPTGTHMSLGPQNPTKKLTVWVKLLGHLLSRNHVSNFFDLGLPPPPPPPPPFNDSIELVAISGAEAGGGVYTVA